MSVTSRESLWENSVFPYLGETNVGALLTETLTADVETVFANQTSLVSADTAIKSQ